MQGFFFSIQFCDVAEVAIVHNISDLARFGNILDIKLEKKLKKESMKVKYSTIFFFPSKNIFSFEIIFSKILKINIISVEAAKVLRYFYYSIVLLVGPNPKPMYDVPMCLHTKMKLGQVSNVKRMMMMMLLLHGKCINMGSPISSLVMSLQLLCYFLLESLINQLIFFTTISPF